MDGKVKRTPGCTTVSSKNQITIPVAALRAAKVGPGDQLRVDVDEDGRIVLSRAVDLLDSFVGSIPGLTAATDLEGVRDEWQR